MPFIQADCLDRVSAIIERLCGRIAAEDCAVQHNITRSRWVDIKNDFLRIGIGGKVGDNCCVSIQREIQVGIGRICYGNIPVQYIPEQKQFSVFFLGFKCHRNPREICCVQGHIVRANVYRIDLNLAQAVYDDGQRY